METGTNASMNMMAAMGMGDWTEADMRRRFWIALVLTIPLIVIAMRPKPTSRKLKAEPPEECHIIRCNEGSHTPDSSPAIRAASSA